MPAPQPIEATETVTTVEKIDLGHGPMIPLVSTGIINATDKDGNAVEAMATRGPANTGQTNYDEVMCDHHIETKNEKGESKEPREFAIQKNHPRNKCASPTPRATNWQLDPRHPLLAYAVADLDVRGLEAELAKAKTAKADALAVVTEAGYVLA